MIGPCFFAPTASNLWTPANMANPPGSIWMGDNASAGASSAWLDTGSNGLDLTRGTGAVLTPGGLNGKQTVNFMGGSTSFAKNSTAAAKALFQNKASAWVFMVYRCTDATAALRFAFYSSTNASNAARFCLTSGNTSKNRFPGFRGRRADADSAAQMDGAAGLDNTDFHMVLLTQDWANRTGTLYVDGALSVQNTTLTSAGAATSNTASFDAITMGGAASGSTTLIEVAGCLLGNGPLPTTAEIDKLPGWAASNAEWGLQAKLPSGHPYKVNPPTV